jgi:acyl-coenzyme A thioesterase PaaI-like protein
MADPDAASVLVTGLPFPKHVGIRPNEDGALVLAENESLYNHVGTLHAGALFTLGESASGATMLRLLAPALAGAMPVAKSAAIEYRKPARGRIRAAGSLAESVEEIAARLKQDKKATFDVRVSLQDDAGVEVATMNVTWYVRSDR